MSDPISARRLAATFGFIMYANVACAQSPNPSRPSASGASGITQAEKDACGEDATRLCSNAYPDAEKLLACMKANRASLSPACSSTFAAGLKRRGM